MARQIDRPRMTREHYKCIIQTKIQPDRKFLVDRLPPSTLAFNYRVENIKIVIVRRYAKK